MAPVELIAAPSDLTLEAAKEHYKAGRLPQAEAICRQLLRERPNDPEMLNLLGRVTLAAGNPGIAIAFIQKAIVRDPNNPSFHSSLGIALQTQGKLDDAVASYHRALEIDPNYVKGYLNLGSALREKGETDEAIKCFRRAIEIKPDFALAHLNLGITLQDRLDLDEAITSIERTLELTPDNAAAHSFRAGLSLLQGRLEESIAEFRHALALDPAQAEIHSNLLFAMHFSPACDRDALLAEAREWDRRHAQACAGEMGPHRNDPDPERKLRIGYVSGDFHRHPVGYFLEAVLRAHDKTRVEVFCYSNHHGVDDLSIRLHAAADHWRVLVGATDPGVAAAIRRDQIDILVDLTGHTGGHRLGVFARKPAPVQATWVGYFDTTGVAAIDYILLDRFLCPPGDERVYVERVVRLPGTYLCYAPQSPAALTPLPAIRHGFVTFGSFNKAPKITPQVIALWARILDALPTARLCLKDIGFDNAGVRARYLEQFAAQGVGAERITLLGRTPYAEHEAAYGQIDLGLDPFPFNGGTTTVEALWAGVPVVTLAGDHFVSRMGVSHLSAVGLADLIAETPEEYVAKAVGLAHDLPRLADLRATLAERMAESICDGERFTRGLEDAYRAMWRTWCHTQTDRA